MECCSFQECGENHGNCHSDNECKDDLKCGYKNCVGSQFPQLPLHAPPNCCYKLGSGNNKTETILNLKFVLPDTIKLRTVAHLG